jgi:hypothetical protein
MVTRLYMPNIGANSFELSIVSSALWWSVNSNWNVLNLPHYCVFSVLAAKKILSKSSALTHLLWTLVGSVGAGFA